jgi:SAM-dependent methyltransferase
MGRAMDYDGFAGQYRLSRWAFPWIEDALHDELSDLPDGAHVVEIGCGTGNYIIELAKRAPRRIYQGFDRSKEMLALAVPRLPGISYEPADADRRFPYGDGSVDAAFAVDVIHHIERLDVFFREASRVLKPGGKLLIVTDSEDDIRNRSLTRFFPEILEIELERYPAVANLLERAGENSLRALAPVPAEGFIEIDGDFIAKLESRCSSAMRLIAAEAHRRGVDRVREAMGRGERWLSCYTMLRFVRNDGSERRDEDP